MIHYTDLLGIPYKRHGRDKAGLDCYGLVLEMCRRYGKPLKDFYNDFSNLSEINPSLNLFPYDYIEEGVIIQIKSLQGLHIGFTLNKREFIHATEKGVCVSPICRYEIIGKYKW